MKKIVTRAFGKDVFLIGRGKDGCHYWLEAPSWDCGWYWGFGYIETYTLDMCPSRSRDISSHSHFDVMFLRGPKNGYDMFKDFFEETVLDDKEIWTLIELMQTFYTLREMAELCHRGGSHYTTNPIQTLLQDTAEEKKLNAIIMPPVMWKVCELLGKEVKGGTSNE